MSGAMTAEQYDLVRPLMIVVYLMWGILWGLVAWHYGAAAFASWRREKGRWRDALRDLLGPFTWAVRDTLCRWRILGGPKFCGTEIPSRYSNGHNLRFAIFLGSLTPMTFGFFFLRLDRSDWSLFDVAINVLFVTSSVIAAGGHLFLAYKIKPYAWRRLVLLSLAVVTLGLPVSYLLR